MQTLTQFYAQFFEPVCLGHAAPATTDAYRYALQHWRRIVGDPALVDITPPVLAAFASGLRGTTWRGRLLSINTVRKHLRHVQAVLDRTGPAGPGCRDAAGILAAVPWVRPPRAELVEKPAVDVADLAAFYHGATQYATLPDLPGLPAPRWWRAVVSVICSTSLRIGQVVQIPTAAVRWQESKLVLPPQVSRKSKREETKPLHHVALADLVAVRDDRRTLILPQPHAKTTIYRELYRLQRLAGVERFSFHQIRRAVLTEFAQSSPTAALKAAGHASIKTTLDHYIGLESINTALGQSAIMQALA